MGKKICSECGKEFESNRKRYTCSPDCSYNRQIRVHREYQQAHAPYWDMTKKCPICGKEFVDIRGQKKYCSDKCKRTLEKERYEAKKHPMSEKTTPAARKKPLWKECKRRRCIFFSYETYTCDYILHTGEPRGSSMEECTRWKE